MDFRQEDDWEKEEFFILPLYTNSNRQQQLSQISEESQRKRKKEIGGLLESCWMDRAREKENFLRARPVEFSSPALPWPFYLFKRTNLKEALLARSLSPLACWPSIAASCSSFPPLSLCRSQSSASLRRSNLLVVSSQQPLVHCCCATGDRNGARRWGSSASFIPSPLPFASLNLLALQVDGTWWSSSARKDEASSGANKSNCPTVIRLKRIVRSLSLSLSLTHSSYSHHHSILFEPATAEATTAQVQPISKLNELISSLLQARQRLLLRENASTTRHLL